VAPAEFDALVDSLEGKGGTSGNRLADLAPWLLQVSMHWPAGVVIHVAEMQADGTLQGLSLRAQGIPEPRTSDRPIVLVRQRAVSVEPPGNAPLTRYALLWPDRTIIPIEGSGNRVFDAVSLALSCLGETRFSAGRLRRMAVEEFTAHRQVWEGFVASNARVEGVL
jgi:hypothetical protein